MEEKKGTQAAEEQQEKVVEQPATGETATEQAPEHTPREVFIERIRTARPDAKYDEDEEEVYRQAGSYMDEIGGRAKMYDDMQEKFKARFGANPDEAAAILDYLDGNPLMASLRRNLGDEALSIKEGDDGWDEYQKAGEERKQRLEEAAARLNEFRKNDEESTQVFDNFLKESGMEEADADNFRNVVVSIVNDMAAGKISKETLTMLKHAVDYDKDVEGARAQGEVDGKNAKIEIERKRMQGSGLPNANAGGEAETEVREEKNPTAEWLGRFKRR